MNIQINKKQLLGLASIEGRSAKYLLLDLILRTKNLSPINPDTMMVGLEEGEHYYKHFINDLRNYSDAWLETIKEIKSDIDDLIKKTKTQQESKREEGKNKGDNIVPHFQPEHIQSIYDILKDYFLEEQHNELLMLLKTGNKTKYHLLFNDNGFRLADAFRILKNNEIIKGCDKKDLIDWLFNNFKYKKRGKNEYSLFNKRTIEDYIYSPVNSKGSKLCKNPILEVKTDEVTHVKSIVK